MLFNVEKITAMYFVSQKYDSCRYLYLIGDLFIMAALCIVCNRAGHYVCALWFLSSSIYLCFFPGLILAATD